MITYLMYWLAYSAIASSPAAKDDFVFFVALHGPRAKQMAPLSCAVLALFSVCVHRTHFGIKINSACQ